MYKTAVKNDNLDLIQGEFYILFFPEFYEEIYIS